MQILPFNTKSFECTPKLPNLNKDSDASEEVVLQSYPVEIATVNGSGPIPTAFTEPPLRRKEDDSGNPLGLFGQYGYGTFWR